MDDLVVNDVVVKTVFVTGGTGFVGRSLINNWSKYDDCPRIIVQTRNIAEARKMFASLSNIAFVSRFSDVNSSEDVDLVVNLAGAPIADKIWTRDRKRVLRDSRVVLSRQLFDDVSASGKTIKLLIQASAVGIYGYLQPIEKNPCSESDSVGTGFAAELCAEWENTCLKVRGDIFERVVVLRFGIILGNGGLLSKLLPVFKCGFGGPIGSGNQAFPWVHLSDVLGFIDFSIGNIAIEGSYNLVAPQDSLQGQFAASLAGVLNRPAFCRVPAWFLRSIMGQLAEELLLGGRFISASNVVKSGYVFKFPVLNMALLECV